MYTYNSDASNDWALHIAVSVVSVVLAKVYIILPPEMLDTDLFQVHVYMLNIAANLSCFHFYRGSYWHCTSIKM